MSFTLLYLAILYWIGCRQTNGPGTTLCQLGLCSEQIKDVKEDLLTSEQLASYRFKHM